VELSGLMEGLELGGGPESSEKHFSVAVMDADSALGARPRCLKDAPTPPTPVPPTPTPARSLPCSVAACTLTRARSSTTPTHRPPHAPPAATALAPGYGKAHLRRAQALRALGQPSDAAAAAAAGLEHADAALRSQLSALLEELKRAAAAAPPPPPAPSPPPPAGAPAAPAPAAAKAAAPPAPVRKVKVAVVEGDDESGDDEAGAAAPTPTMRPAAAPHKSGQVDLESMD